MLCSDVRNLTNDLLSANITRALIRGLRATRVRLKYVQQVINTLRACLEHTVCQVNAHVQREQGAEVILSNVLAVGQGFDDLESEGRHFDSLAGGVLYKYNTINGVGK